MTRWLLPSVFLALMLALIIIPVTAAPYVMQGDTVCVDQTIDISGVLGGYSATAWYGTYGEYVDPAYLIDLPISKKGWYSFYLDPAIFGKRLGPWYKFTGNTTGVEHGNTVAFYVDSKDKCQEVNVTNVTPTIRPEPTPAIPTTVVQNKKFDTDYQIAKGDSLTLPVNTKLAPPRLWVFGRIDKVYNKSFTKQTVFLSAAEIQNLEAGPYTVIAQFPGKNTIFEVGYSKVVDVANSKTIEQLTSPWASVKPIDIFGSQPSIVLMNFIKMVGATDDTIVQYRLEISSPILDIASIDETYEDGKDVLDIRGYTNVAKGTLISVVMDEDKQTERTIKENTFTTIVKEEAPNLWRYFQIYLPINYETIPVGQHEITASTPQGAKQTVPFYVYDLPKGQVIPNETIKYVAGNIFVAPEIVTVVQTIKIIETQTIFVPVTPRDDVVYAQQKKASDANYWYWISTGATVLVIGVVLSLSGWYVIRVIKKARLR